MLRGYIPSVPRIRRLSEAGNARQGFFTDEEMRRLLPHLPDSLRDFTLFAYLSGWRKSEIASLTWADFDGTCLRLRGSKTGEQRILPLNAQLAALIDQRRQKRQGALIFHRVGHVWTRRRCQGEVTHGTFRFRCRPVCGRVMQGLVACGP
jgi:integrase